jgi:imidazolonepropionase-like amidohydrolase
MPARVSSLAAQCFLFATWIYAIPASAEPTASRSIDEFIQSSNSFQISDVTVFDGEKLIENATVIVKGGWIDQVCAGSKSPCPVSDLPAIDGKGKFLMPSLIDSEGHFTRPAEMLGQLLNREEPICGDKPENKGQTLSASSTDVLAAFAAKGLFTEIDTHGLRADNGMQPQKLGGRYDIPPSANYEKHIRFGVTTVLDMGAYPWPANYVRRSRDHWANPKDAEQADLRKEFLIYADFFGSGMWASPANMQFGYYGVDPVYNVKPDGPWTASEVQAWVDRRLSEGSDHIKVFYEHWKGKPAQKFDSATLTALVQAAHARGAKVFVHNESEADAEAVMTSGADVNIHAPGMYDVKSEVLSDDFAARFAKAIKVVSPTLWGMVQNCENPYGVANKKTHALSAGKPGASFIKDYFETADVLPYVNALDEIRVASCRKRPGPEFERLFQNTAKLYDHGVMLLAGADAGEVDPVIEGLGLHYEAFLIREALDKYSTTAKGQLASLAALKALTSNAALAYGLHIENGNKPKHDPRGFIKPGYRADLLLLRESPMVDMLNTLKIERVFKAGYTANRQMVRPECASGDCETRKILRAVEARSCK